MGENIGTLWKGAKPLLGTMIGVGIFGLPFALSHSGFAIGFLELLVIGGLNLVVLFIYADIIELKNSPHRFIGVIGDELGFFGRVLTTFAFFGSMLGAMTAYILVGGAFAYSVLSPHLGGHLLFYQLVFWMLGSVVMLGGTFFVAKIQSFIIPLFFLLIFIVTILAAPAINLDHLTTMNADGFVLPLGVILFAFGGLSAIPEMRDVLKREKRSLKGSILFGTILVGLLYVLFSFVILGASGKAITPDSITGLHKVVGPAAIIIGSVLGMLTTFSAFVTVGVSLSNTLVFDYRYRYTSAWFLIVSVPIILFIIGARDFIGVLQFTGGVLSSLIGLLLIFVYERLRLSNALPKRALSIPQWLIALSFMMFVGMFALTLLSALL
jgi:tyrosine-specific transport protein